MCASLRVITTNSLDPNVDFSLKKIQREENNCKYATAKQLYGTINRNEYKRMKAPSLPGGKNSHHLKILATTQEQEVGDMVYCFRKKN